MIVRVRKIGNSAGILLSKSMIEQCDIKDSVHLEVKDKSIIIQPIKLSPREGWSQKFLLANSLTDNENPLGEISNTFDNEEWTW